MRLLDQEPIDPDIAEQLDAIDATLAGEPVDPRHAELAELALMLRAERPQMSHQFSLELDRRAARRFVKRPGRPRQRLFARTWVWGPAASALALGACVALLVVSGPFGTSTESSSSASAQSSSSASGAGLQTPAVAAQSGAKVAAPNPVRAPSLAPSSAGALAQAVPGGLTPPTTGRKITQSSQLDLTAAPTEIDGVSQELYNVVGSDNGIVDSSNVTQTGRTDGSATFQLSIPSSTLPATMARLSDLPNSRVASRTDSTQDVTSRYNALTAELSGAQALRTALLKQLATAMTTQQIDSISGQIHDTNGEIASYESQLGGLNHQISYSPVSVTITAAAIPATRTSSGFTIGKALRTARHLLTVVAGGGLIALAGLLPVALLVALVWWILATLRRRRREHALDLA